MSLDVVVVERSDEAGEVVADIIEEAVASSRRDRRGAVLGLATGSTPADVYAALVSRRADLSGALAFALDEYVGLAESHPQSYRSVLRREVVEPLGLDPASLHVPGADTCALFERELAGAGGVDVQLLGIGSNGHIAFNEPGSPFDSRTRVVRLAEQTRVDNARFFNSIDEVPTHAVTQGLATILGARRLVLLAFGERKAAALAAALEGDETVSMPASILRRHPNVSVFADEAAASLLRRSATRVL